MTFSTLASPGVSLQGGGGSGGGGGTPGGSNTQIQYNNSGAFAGASGLTTNGTELTIASGTVTADAPVLNMSQTWNNAAVTFTGLKFNADGTSDANSAAASLLMDLQVDEVSRFNVTKMGGVNIRSIDPTFRLGYLTENQLVINQGVLNAASNFQVGFSSSSIGVTTLNMDTILTRRAAANFRLGAADTSTSATVTITIAAPGVVTWSSNPLSTGTPVVFSTTGALPTGITAGTTYYAVVVTASTFQIATSFANAIAATPTVVTTSGSQSGTHTIRRGAIAQTLSVQDTLSTGSLENIDGADFVIRGSRSIGNKPGGSIIFQVAPAGSSGTAQNALSTALTINSNQTATLARTNGTDSAVDLQFAGTANTGWWSPGGTTALIASFAGTRMMDIRSQGVSFSNGTILLGPVAGNQAVLVADAANTLALRNGGTNASPVPQTFNVYSFYAGAADYSRLSVLNVSGVPTIRTEGAGTGAAAQMAVYAGGSVLYLGSNNTGQWSISSGHFLASPDNTYDIGAAGGSRPRNVYVGNELVTGGLLTSGSVLVINGSRLQFTNGTRLYGNVDGVLTLLNTAETGFTSLKFGGTTSSFPALKRSSASLIVRLADDTANAALESASLKTDAPTGGTAATWKLGTVASVTPTLQNRTIEVDIGGTIYYISAKTTND
jgi:hypothetical protein